MKRKALKTLVLILVLIASISVFAACCELDSQTTNQELVFTSNGDGTCCVSKIRSYDKSIIVIPFTSPDGDSVTTIGRYAFSGCTNLTSVTIPDSVTTIGDHAFKGCTSLTSVTIGDGVTSIGDNAFDGCTSLTSVAIPDSVTSISQQAFSGCTSFTSVTIGDSVEWIGTYAFYYCTSLTSVTIGDSVTEIGNYAFYDCTSLKTVCYTGSEAQWSKISIGYYNELLTDAAMIYNYTGE